MNFWCITDSKLFRLIPYLEGSERNSKMRNSQFLAQTLAHKRPQRLCFSNIINYYMCALRNRIATELFSVWLRFRIETCMNWTLLTLSIKCGWMNSISKACKRIKSNYWPIIEKKTHFQCKTTTAAIGRRCCCCRCWCSIADVAVVFIVVVAPNVFNSWVRNECTMHMAHVTAHPHIVILFLFFGSSTLDHFQLHKDCLRTAFCSAHCVLNVAVHIFHWGNYERW